MSSSASPSNSSNSSKSAPRRASVQSPSSLFTCVVSSCSLPAIRRGGYCIPHQNQFAVATTGVTSASTASEKDKGKPIAAEQVCFGHACQGQIRFGFCSRHRLLSAELENQLQAQLQIQSNPPVSPSSPSHSAAPLPSAASNSDQEFLKVFLSGLHAIYSAIEPHLAAEAIIRETCRILSAERATLFYVDGDELILMIARGVRNIRLPRSKGVAGYVSTAAVTVNIPDAYKEAKFDSSFDTQTGFRTRNILATPVFDQDGKVIAVLQVINKYQRTNKTDSANARGSLDENSIAADFTPNDQIALEALAFHVSVSLRNAEQFEASKRAETKVSSILEVISMLHSDQDPSMNSIIFTLTTRSPQLVDCDRCTLYLVDYARDQLVVMTGDVDIRIPLSKGIAGACATSSTIINIPDCYQDSRFNTEIDKKTGYRTKSMLCVPIPGAKGQGETTAPVIGVLQLINRNDEQPFSREDEQMLSTLLKIAGPILQKYSHFNDAKSSKQSKANAINEPALAMKPKAKSPIGAGPAPSSLKFKPSLGGNIREGPE